MSRRALATVACGLVVAGATVAARLQVAQPQQTPTFRTGVNMVMVDAYPLRDGKVVEGLTADDFQILEDGKPQKVETFEFVRIEPTPELEQRDPTTLDESLKLAADPHNRVFVVYLDQHFVRVDGSHAIRQPLVTMLDRILAANDLFGIMTPPMRATDVTFARKVVTARLELDKYWTWGTRDSHKPWPEGELAALCYTTPSKQGAIAGAVDPQPMRPIPDEILQRNYEDHTLFKLDELIVQLGRVREARSSVVLVTDGWVLYQPDESLVRQVSDQTHASYPPGISVGPGGRIGVGSNRAQDAYGGKDLASCDSEVIRLARIDDRQRMKDLIATANRNNVTFYAVNPGGLTMWDQSPVTMTSSQRRDAVDKAGQDPNAIGRPNMASVVTDRVQSRIETLQTLTANTDGIAIVNTNDLTGGLRRIVDAVSSYYLIGYYSTNPKVDGQFRRIDVRVPGQQKIRMTARRGYRAGGDNRPPAIKPAPNAVDTALAKFARLDGDVDLLGAVQVTANTMTVVAEIPGRPIEQGRWLSGGTLAVTVTDAAGNKLPAPRAQIAAGERVTAVTVPIDPAANGPWTVVLTLTDRDNAAEERLEVRRPQGPLLGDPAMFRGTPSARSALVPAAAGLYRRTERAHVEWPMLKDLDKREARLVGRNGEPIAVEIALTERTTSTGRMLAADLILGPLAVGDYAIEVTAGAGSDSQKQLVPIRIIR